MLSSHRSFTGDAQERVTLTSRAFYNDQLPRWAAEMTHAFGYETILPMNTGAEARELMKIRDRAAAESQ